MFSLIMAHCGVTGPIPPIIIPLKEITPDGLEYQKILESLANPKISFRFA
jgi:hypothetical protein